MIHSSELFFCGNVNSYLKSVHLFEAKNYDRDHEMLLILCLNNLKYVLRLNLEISFFNFHLQTFLFDLRIFVGCEFKLFD